MSALPLRRLRARPEQHIVVARRFQSTDSFVPPVLSYPSSNYDTESTQRPFWEKPAHTHFLAIPMDNGTFHGRLRQLQEFLRKNGSLAGVYSDMVAPDSPRSRLFRFGHLNIEGYRSNKESFLNQRSFKFSQVEEALEKARARISNEVDKNALRLTWGTVSPTADIATRHYFAFGNTLYLRPKPSPAVHTIQQLQNIVFQELKSAGITNFDIRESPMVYLTLINIKWRNRYLHFGIKRSTKSFNVKTLYTIPGFDRFRTTPIRTNDKALTRLTALNLGTSHVNSFVLEGFGPNSNAVDSDSVITKSFEF